MQKQTALYRFVQYSGSFPSSTSITPFAVHMLTFLYASYVSAPVSGMR